MDTLVTWKDMFIDWSKKYKGTFMNKPILKSAWQAMPKFVYWKVWLAHNKTIFDQGNVNPKSIVAKARGLLIEAIKARGVKGHNVSLMEQEERIWLRDFLMMDDTQPKCIFSYPTQR
jgi:hypothetical protein